MFHRRVAATELVSAILADRRAALLCHGLAALDDETLAFFGEHPAALTRLYVDDAAAFAVFGGSLHVRDGRVRPPGGDAAAPLWEAVVREKVTRPDRFVRELLRAGRRDGSRTSTTRSASSIRRSGVRARPVDARTPRCARSASAAGRGERRRVPRVAPAGPCRSPGRSSTSRCCWRGCGSTRTDRAAPPAARALWSAAFGSGDLSDDEAAHAACARRRRAGRRRVARERDRRRRRAAARRSARSVGASDSACSRARGEADRAAALIALRAFDRDRMLMLTLERIGITNPAVYAAAARHASRLARCRSPRGVRGARAVSRRAGAGRADGARPRHRRRGGGGAAHLACRRAGRRRRIRRRRCSGGSIASFDRWRWAPRASRRGLIARLAGARPGPAPAPIRVSWEGQPTIWISSPARSAVSASCAKDSATCRSTSRSTSKRRRRRCQSSRSRPTISAAAVASLKRAAAMIPARSKEEAVVEPDGVGVPHDPREVIAAAVDDLVKAQKAHRPRVAHVAEPLAAVADAIGADALLSLAYAVDLGEPDGTALLAANVARRHDFGFALNDADARARAAVVHAEAECRPRRPVARQRLAARPRRRAGAADAAAPRPWSVSPTRRR